MSKRLLLIMNPYAGKRMGRRYLADILEKFCRGGYIPTVFMTTEQGQGRLLAAQYGREADVVVCVGGDGTFNEVVSGLLENGLDVPIGYIPCGSTNDFAGSIGLPRDLLKAADVMLEGAPRTYDVGQFGNRYFTYIASFGAFTRASYATPQNTKNVLGHLAYVLEGLKDLPSLRPWHLRFETEDAIFEGDYIFGAVSNSTSVGGILTLDPTRVDMNDGLLELLLVRMPANAAELNDCI
ncbi:MAG: YegS/Rv2252/BmrU family lipid kinase, partial [Clostridia bacterium]|nr:YegS/Rv2252/BmrU family lipid kinase [Clostridia bacterium]